MKGLGRKPFTMEHRKEHRNCEILPLSKDMQRKVPAEMVAANPS